ncbi:hypothetical protein D3C78_1299540 [compost metagenome]
MIEVRLITDTDEKITLGTVGLVTSQRHTAMSMAQAGLQCAFELDHGQIIGCQGARASVHDTDAHRVFRLLIGRIDDAKNTAAVIATTVHVGQKVRGGQRCLLAKQLECKGPQCRFQGNVRRCRHGCSLPQDKTTIVCKDDGAKD